MRKINREAILMREVNFTLPDGEQLHIPKGEQITVLYYDGTEYYFRCKYKDHEFDAVEVVNIDVTGLFEAEAFDPETDILVKYI